MEFKKITVNDKSIIESFTKSLGDNNCETDFINLLLWQNLYGISCAVSDNALLIKIENPKCTMYSIPFGDIKAGLNALLKCENGAYPVIRAQQGARFEKFCKEYGDIYDITELDEGVDYIYLREDLALLKGKKYHAKRNHISAFSKQFDWSYEEIDKSNLADVRTCAEKWYKEHADRFTKEMGAERDGVNLIIDNLEALGVKGGAIRVAGEIVAFTFASFINDEAVDIHIEKALTEFSTAYTVINNQFAQRLPQTVKYINREDDLGLEGLRKAKLSYHPAVMLKKYILTPKKV